MFYAPYVHMMGTRLTLGSTPKYQLPTYTNRPSKLTVQVLVPLCLGLCDTISVSLLVLVVANSQSPSIPSTVHCYSLGVVL